MHGNRPKQPTSQKQRNEMLLLWTNHARNNMISIYNRAEGKTRIVKHIINTYSVDAPTKEQRDERTRRLREATKQYFKGNLNEALETLHVPTYYDGEEK